MNTFALDSSVVIGALLTNHPSHEWCQPWLAKARAGEHAICVSQHLLGEVYHVLSATRWPQRLSPTICRSLLTANIRPSEVVSIPADLYWTALELAERQNLSGAVVYDLVHLLTALSTGADAFVTLNAKDFRRLRPNSASYIIAP